MWRSLVAHLLWEQGVARSNRVIPTKGRTLHEVRRCRLVKAEPGLARYPFRTGAPRRTSTAFAEGTHLHRGTWGCSSAG